MCEQENTKGRRRRNDKMNGRSMREHIDKEIKNGRDDKKVLKR